MVTRRNFCLLTGVNERRFWDGLLALTGTKRDGENLLMRGCLITPNASHRGGIVGFKLTGPHHNATRALTAIASRLRIEIGEESEDFGPYLDEDEASAFMALDEERVDRLQTNVLAYLRGEPHDLVDVADPYVRIAQSVVDDNPGLLREGSEEAFFQTVRRRARAEARLEANRDCAKGGRREIQIN